VEYKAIRGQGIHMRVVTIKTDSPSKLRRKIRAIKDQIETYEHDIDEREMDIGLLEEEIRTLRRKIARLKENGRK
jgi:peptidoglycan hydrolase CwlO-like protein